jgi:hypothetical protein
MSIRKITYRNKTQTVKQWSIELGIPTKTIYQRLNLDWPPELALSSKYFHYCDDFKAANKVEQRDGYPTDFYDYTETRSCCSNNAMCKHAIPITPYKDISNDVDKATYYCKHLEQFVWGEDPKC